MGWCTFAGLVEELVVAFLAEALAVLELVVGLGGAV